MFHSLILFCAHLGRSRLFPIIGCPCSSMHIANSGIWKLDHKQLTFSFKVQLPYDKVRVLKKFVTI